MKIRNKIGNFFALCVAIAFCMVIYAENRDNKDVGYNLEQRQDMTELVAQNTDFDAIPRLSVEDLQ